VNIFDLLQTPSCYGKFFGPCFVCFFNELVQTILVSIIVQQKTRAMPSSDFNRNSNNPSPIARVRDIPKSDHTDPYDQRILGNGRESQQVNQTFHSEEIRYGI
jgi:hypothetical protein